MKMESEEVLHLIMKKLKEYKANPMRSAIHEKARQKNLRKMFSIYATLKKKERAKQRLKEQIQCIKQSKLSQQMVKNENQNSCVPQCDNVPISYDLSTHDRFVAVSDQDHSGECQNVPVYNLSPKNRVTDSEIETENIQVEADIEVITSVEQVEGSNDADFEETVMPTPSTSATLYLDNERIKKQNHEKVEEFSQNQCIDQSAAIDGFLMQLGEGLKKLPYKQRCKLEIEFLARLYEIEECTGVLDD